MNDALKDLTQVIREFVDAREWDQFHTTKDMAVGMVTESAELLDLFRFKDEAQCRALLDSPATRETISDELADVFFWVLRFADKNQIDLSAAFHAKMKKNGAKYPVEKSRGNNRKYTEF